MNLTDYPAQIYEKSIALAAIDQELTTYRKQATDREMTADRTVATDASLKNDTTRKVRRYELLMADRQYINAQYQIDLLTHARSEALADLELLRNQFAVAKLEVQLEIARSQVGAPQLQLAS